MNIKEIIIMKWNIMLISIRKRKWKLVSFNEYESQKSEYFQNSCLEVFATNYNQLRIISGMGGLTFSN